MERGDHGSLPTGRGANPLLALAEAVARLEKPLSYRKTIPAESFVAAIASAFSFPKATVLKLLLREFWAPFLLDRIPAGLGSYLKACFYNTAVPTVLAAGENVNVVPSEAVLLIDGRFLPGMVQAEFLQELKERLKGLEAVLEIEKSGHPHVAPTDTPLYRAIENTLRHHDAQGIALPTMISGFTDAKQYRDMGAICYGFSPLKLPPSFPFSELFHGTNERVPIPALLWGADVLYDLVVQFCSD